MRIKSVEIENFRSIRLLACDFDAVTSLIGPNGAGKSNVLRAMDWFFNADKSSLTVDDIHKGSINEHEPEPRIRVRVDFTDLTPEDRAALGPRYCPDATVTEFTAWRTWPDGIDKITGRALAYEPFEAVRMGQSATDRGRPTTHSGWATPVWACLRVGRLRLLTRPWTRGSARIPSA